MLLCIDVGNSHIFGGVFQNDDIKFRFRLTSQLSTSDEFGVLLRAVLKENKIEIDNIKNVAISSVVPQLDYSLRSAIVKYFSIEPFWLKASLVKKLNFIGDNIDEMGSDRVANALAATTLYPKKPLIVISFGTATTICALSEDAQYLGGVIMPGVRLWMESLSKNTAKLPSVEIIHPKRVLGSTTVDHIQSGIFYGVLGSCKELICKISNEVFKDNKPIVIGTGGFAKLLENQGVYDFHEPDLVLYGIKFACEGVGVD